MCKVHKKQKECRHSIKDCEDRQARYLVEVLSIIMTSIYECEYCGEVFDTVMEKENHIIFVHKQGEDDAEDDECINLINARRLAIK
jgi:hypothetical protein